MGPMTCHNCELAAQARPTADFVSIRVSDRIHVGSTGWRVRGTPRRLECPLLPVSTISLPRRGSLSLFLSLSLSPSPAWSSRGEPVTRDYFDASRSRCYGPSSLLRIARGRRDTDRGHTRLLTSAYGRCYRLPETRTPSTKCCRQVLDL